MPPVKPKPAKSPFQPYPTDKWKGLRVFPGFINSNVDKARQSTFKALQKMGTANLRFLCAHTGILSRDKAMHRQLLDVGAAITQRAGDDRLTAIEALERAEQGLLAIARHAKDSKPQHIAEVGQESYERYSRLHDTSDKSALFGLTTGFRDLDDMVTGLSPGSLVIVAARPAGENRTQQVSHISRSLKNLARELGVPIITLSQLSRSTEQRTPPIPILSDLRDSGGIEQDADIVLMLYREDMYNEDCAEPGETDVYIRKNRNGPVGRAGLFFDKKKMSFRDLAR